MLTESYVMDFLDEFDLCQYDDTCETLFENHSINYEILKYIACDPSFGSNYVTKIYEYIEYYDHISLDELFSIIDEIEKLNDRKFLINRIYHLINENNVLYITEYFMSNNYKDSLLDVIDIFLNYPSNFTNYTFGEVLDMIKTSKYFDYVKNDFSKDYLNKHLASKNPFIETLFDFLGFERFPSGRIINTIKEYPFKQLPYDAKVLSSEDNVIYRKENHGIIESIYDDVYIPIIRYETKGGRYYYEEEEKSSDIVQSYCGYYYYYEPNSIYFLKSSKTLIAPNKFLAIISLTRRDNKHAPSKYHKYLAENLRSEYASMIINQTGYDYLTFKPEMYAGEDVFDQELCNIASEKGYEAILLTTMAGGSRIVSEVLDTREREDSEANIFTY